MIKQALEVCRDVDAAGPVFKTAIHEAADLTAEMLGASGKLRPVHAWQDGVVSELWGTPKSTESAGQFGLRYKAIASPEEIGLPNLQVMQQAIAAITKQIRSDFTSHGSSFHLGDGKFATAFHSVADRHWYSIYENARLEFFDGQTSAFEVIAADPRHDTAIVRATDRIASTLPVIDFAREPLTDFEGPIFAMGLARNPQILRIGIGQKVEPIANRAKVAFYEDAQAFNATVLGGMSGGPIVKLDRQQNWQAVSSVAIGNYEHTCGPPLSAMNAIRDMSQPQTRLENWLRKQRMADRDYEKIFRRKVWLRENRPNMTEAELEQMLSLPTAARQQPTGTGGRRLSSGAP